MASGSITTSPALDVSAARERRELLRRDVVVRRLVVARLCVVLAALRVPVAARLVVVAERFAVVVARRRVVVARELVPRAIARACLVRSSIRLSTLFTSARVLARLT